MNNNSVFLFYGDEKYLIKTDVNKIKKNFGKIVNGINYITIDESNVDSLISNLQTPAFGFSKKLIICKNTGLFNNKTDELEKEISEFINKNFEVINENNVLIFIEDDVNKNSLYKSIEKNGKIFQYNKLKPIETQKKIKDICNAYKVNIDNQTVSYFIEICGTDMHNLINEIRKQIEYAGPGGTITKQSIDMLAIKKLEVKIFDLTDNLGKKQVKESLNILSTMLYEKEPIQRILITLYNHFKKLYITKIAIREKKNIAEVLNLKPNQLFLTTKYSNQSKYFSEKELKDILQSMIDLDYNYKKGNIDPQIGLETIICKLAG